MLHNHTSFAVCNTHCHSWLQAALMEAQLHALQLCVAIACTQHQLASHHCKQQPVKHCGMRQCYTLQEECCMTDTECSRCKQILSGCSIAVLLWGLMQKPALLRLLCCCRKHRLKVSSRTWPVWHRYKQTSCAAFWARSSSCRSASLSASTLWRSLVLLISS